MGKKNKTIEELLDEALVLVNEKPYEIPSNWVWTKLDYVAQYKKGPFGSAITKAMFVPKGKNTYKVYEQGNAIRKDINYGSYYISEEKYKELKGFKVDPNDLLLSCAGTIGEVYQLPENIEQGIINQALMRIKVEEKINIRYYLWYFDEALKKDITGKAKGTAIKNIPPLAILKKMPFPLPPFNEQKRIVNKIESLFSKIDKAKELINEAREGFENRKAAILAKAFRGELTKKWRETNANSTDIDEFFNEIKEARFNVIETKREHDDMIRMYDSFNYYDPNRPSSWIILKTNMFCYNINCGSTPTAYIEPEGEVPFLKVYNIVDNKVDFEYKPQFIPKDINDSKLKKSKLAPNDVIMNIVGPPLRKIAIIPDDYPEWNMNQAVVRFRPIQYVQPKYLYYALINEETLDEVIAETRGVVGQINISVNQSRNLLIPIPPIDEQVEIVRILDKIMENESKVEELTQLEGQIELLRKSILAKAFRGELSTNDPAEESALKLLEEVLIKKTK